MSNQLSSKEYIDLVDIELVAASLSIDLEIKKRHLDRAAVYAFKSEQRNGELTQELLLSKRE